MERSRLRTYLLLGAITLPPFRAAYAGTPFLDPIYGYALTTDVRYASGVTEGGPIDLRLDIYRPTNIGQGALPALSPAVVIQHGGSWTSGDKDQAFTPGTFLARHGFTVVSAQYRLSGDNPVPGNGPWNAVSFPFYLSIFPGTDAIRAGIEDFGKAMSWTRANAASYGIDPNKIAAAGGSAGGINALLHTYNNPPAASAPQAVVAYVGTLYNNENLINAGEPPAFLLNSVTDSLIPYPDVADMVERMDAVGVYNEPWIQDLGTGVHDVEWDYLLDGKTVLERTKEFLAFHLADVGGNGDFNVDGLVNAADIDLLYGAIHAGAPNGLFDLNNDGTVDNDDLTFELETILHTKFGDTDTDGDVDLADLGNLASGFQIPGEKRWSRGNFDGDGDVDLPDLGSLASNFEAGPARAFAAFENAVPEPAALSLFALSLLGLRRPLRL
jgi:predicted esterase